MANTGYSLDRGLVCYKIQNQPNGGVKFEVVEDVPEPRKAFSARSAAERVK